MHRLFAGVALSLLALTACGHSADGPPPHIVALAVPTTAPAPVATAAPVAATPAVLTRASRAQTARAVATTPIGADVWTRLARCESNGNARAVGGRGRFFGAFQFTLQTWHSMGMTGNPIDYSYADQLAVAQRLQARSGWRNWPVCARRVLRT